jgi:hypothetical protein
MSVKRGRASTEGPQNAPRTRRENQHDEAGHHSEFGFLPSVLTGKCRRLVESYHEIHGYGCLPDMLWDPQMLKFIEKNEELIQLFKKAAKDRSAKRSKESYAQVATTILSLEILATGFADWGKRFPSARDRACDMLGHYLRQSRKPLMERYLFGSKIGAVLDSAVPLPDAKSSSPPGAV